MKLGLGLSLINSKYRNNGVSYGVLTSNLLDQAATDGYQIPTPGVLAALDTQLIYFADKPIDILYSLATNAGGVGDNGDAFSRYNVMNPATFYATKVGTPTFTANMGFNSLGNASNVLNTGWIPATHAVNFTLNNASIIMHTPSTPVDSGVEQVAVGAVTARIIPVSSVGTTRYFINQGNQSSATGGLLGAGTYHANRTISASGNFYYNGVFNDNEADVSTALATLPFFICSGVAAGPVGITAYNGNVAIVLAGASLASEAANIHTVINNYITAITA